MDTVMLAIYALITVGLIAHLWLRAAGSPGRKIAWSLLLCVPMFGWLAYGAMYEKAPKERGGSRAGKNASGWAPHWKDW